MTHASPSWWRAGGSIPVTETPEELALKRKVQLSRGLPPVYDRAALKLTDADRAKLEADGVSPHWRFRLDPEVAIDWDDLVRGHQHFDAASLSDPVIRRGDGSWLYLLPSVIDDIDMNITHVVRGEDHVSNTAAQVQMFGALGAKPPVFAHAALLTGSEGKLSKRLGSLGVDHFRDIGIEPQALISLLARIGTSQPVEPVVDPQPLIDAFDFSHFGRAPARFDETELAQVNARIVHQLPYTRVVRRLPKGMNGMAWNTVKANLSTLNDAAEWWAIITGPFTPPVASGSGPRLARFSGAGSGGRRLAGGSLAPDHEQSEGTDRAERQGTVPAAASGADRQGCRAGHGGAAAPDRARGDDRAVEAPLNSSTD